MSHTEQDETILKAFTSLIDAIIEDMESYIETDSNMSYQDKLFQELNENGKAFLLQSVKKVREQERNNWIEKVTDLWKYLLMLQMKSSEANTESSTDEWNLLETIKEKIDEEFFIDLSLQHKEEEGQK